jgi:hypothetical protein
LEDVVEDSPGMELAGLDRIEEDKVDSHVEGSCTVLVGLDRELVMLAADREL